MRARLPGSLASRSAHGGDKPALDDAGTGCRPLARTAAKRSERMLLSVFGVSPAATGLTAASLGGDRRQIERQAAGVLAHQRRHARHRRAQVAAASGRQRPRFFATSRSTSARVGASSWGDWSFDIFLFHSGAFRVVSGGLGRTRGDGGGHSGILPYHRWDVCLMGVFPISHNTLT